MEKGIRCAMLINLPTELKTSINAIITYGMNQLDNSKNN